MANRIQPTFLGVDVSKAELVVNMNGEATLTLANTPNAIRSWLRSWQEPLEVALEATNDFHMAQRTTSLSR